MVCAFYRLLAAFCADKPRLRCLPHPGLYVAYLKIAQVISLSSFLVRIPEE